MQDAKIFQSVISPKRDKNLEVAVLLTLYVMLNTAYPDSVWKTLRPQLCRK